MPGRKYVYMQIFMLVGVSVIEILLFNRKKKKKKKKKKQKKNICENLNYMYYTCITRYS